MTKYYIVQHFNGYLARYIQAETIEEAQQKFLDQTCKTGQQLEKICQSRFEWLDLDYSPDD